MRRTVLSWILVFSMAGVSIGQDADKKIDAPAAPKLGPKLPKMTIAQLHKIRTGVATPKFDLEQMKVYPPVETWIASAKFTGHDGNVLESERRYIAREKRVAGKYLVTTIQRPGAKTPTYSIATYNKPTHCYVRWMFSDTSAKATMGIGIAEAKGTTLAWMQIDMPDSHNVSIAQQSPKRVNWAQILFRKNRLRLRLDGSAEPAKPNQKLEAAGVRVNKTKIGARLPTMTAQQFRLIAAAPNRDRTDIEQMKLFPTVAQWDMQVNFTSPDGKTFEGDPVIATEKRVDGRYVVSHADFEGGRFWVTIIVTYDKASHCFIKWIMTPVTIDPIRSIGIRLPGATQMAWSTRSRDKTGKLSHRISVETQGTKTTTWSEVVFKDHRFEIRIDGKGHAVDQ
jgi:hypothetical protein